MFFGATPNSFQKAKWLRNNPSKHERILWDRLRNKQILGVRIRRQHPIGTYIADFYCHAAKLVIEIDGKSHGTEKQRAYDAERTFNLRLDSLKVIRFSNDQIDDDLDRVIAEISKHVSDRICLNTE